MREIRQSGSEGGARFNPSFLPLSLFGSCLHRESIGMDSQALRRKNDGVLECARQSAASTPLWSCPKRQTHSLLIQHLHPLHCTQRRILTACS